MPIARVQESKQESEIERKSDTISISASSFDALTHTRGSVVVVVVVVSAHQQRNNRPNVGEQLWERVRERERGAAKRVAAKRVRARSLVAALKYP